MTNAQCLFDICEMLENDALLLRMEDSEFRGLDADAYLKVAASADSVISDMREILDDGRLQTVIDALAVLADTPMDAYRDSREVEESRYILLDWLKH